MFFIVKILISALLIAFASWLAGKKPVLAGFIIALPSSPVRNETGIFQTYLI